VSDHWHKHYHGRILNSYADLSLELRGAGYTILDLIYDAGAPLMLSESSLAGRLGCSIRKWRTIREQLLTLGKLILSEEGGLIHPVCEEVFEGRRKLAENGANGGRTRAENLKSRKENNATPQAPLEKGLKQYNNHKKDRDSVAKATEAEAPQTTKQIIWVLGRAMFEKAGADPKAAGATLGALVKAKGEAGALAIVTTMQANPPVDPGSYLWKIINGKAAPVHDPGAPPQIELVVGEDGRTVCQPIAKVAA